MVFVFHQPHTRTPTRHVITDLSNPVSECVWYGPDFAVVCVVIACMMYILPGEKWKLEVKHKICCESSDYSGITWPSYFDCHASVWRHLLLTTVAKISVWKLFFFSDSSESTCLPERPLVYDSGLGLFTKFCSQLHVFNCQKSNSTDVKKRVGENSIGVPTCCLLRSYCQE